MDRRTRRSQTLSRAREMAAKADQVDSVLRFFEKQRTNRSPANAVADAIASMHTRCSKAQQNLDQALTPP